MAGPGAEKHIIIDGFWVDCSLSENHTFDSDVTEYPVESGSNIVDNIRPLPIIVDIEGFVSNTPIGLIIDKRSSDPDKKPVDDAYSLFEKIRDKREPVTIQTSLRTYENMALNRLSIPRGPGGADGLRFNASFKQIEYVTNVRTIRVSIPIATGGTGKKKDKVIAAPNPSDMRQVLIHPKKNMWWDPDGSTWTFHCSYEEGSKIHDEAGSSTVTNISKWHLYRGQVQIINVGSTIGGATGQEAAVDDPFDVQRFTPPHPLKECKLVTLNQCVLHNFTIKKAVPAYGSVFGARQNAGDIPTTLRRRTQ